MKTLLIFILCGLLLTSALADSVDVHAVVPEVHLKDGSVLQNVKFVSYAATAVMARWDGGRGTIPYKQLPDDIQEAMKSYIPQAVVETPVPTSITAEPAPNPGPTVTLHGQSFIVTKGGENVKLGLVEIDVYPADAWESYRKQVLIIAADRKKRYEAQFRSALRAMSPTAPMSGWDAANAASDAAMHAGEMLPYSMWDALPPALASTKTDADGRFTLTHTVAAPYVVFARATRSVPARVAPDTELYTWIIESGKLASGELLLGNDNVTESSTAPGRRTST